MEFISVNHLCTGTIPHDHMVVANLETLASLLACVQLLNLTD